MTTPLKLLAKKNRMKKVKPLLIPKGTPQAFGILPI